MDKSEAERILDYLKRIDESINGTEPRDTPRKDQRPLSDRVDSVSDRLDSVSDRVDSVSDRVGSVSDRVDSISDRVDSVSDRVDNLDKKIGTSRSNRPLAEQVDNLDDRVGEVQLGLGTLAASTTAQFQNIDRQFTLVGARFDHVDDSIEAARHQIVDLVDRVHDELTGRLIDLEMPGPGGRGGGGRGSGGGGVPLAS